MDFSFHNKKITGILTVLPHKVVRFEDEMDQYSFSPERCMRLKIAMGYKEVRMAEPGQCGSDFCVFGLQYLFDKALLDPNSIDALLFVSQTPDYILPPTSNLIQGHFNLKQDVLCLDINQGCAGFEVGLIEAMLLLEQPHIHKVVLLNADVLSPRISKKDRNSRPLAGDAASITIIEDTPSDSPIYANIKMDGTGALVLNIPAGGSRCPSSAETAVLHQDEMGNQRALDHLVMKGDEVFNFAQREVPPMILHLMEQGNCNLEDVDWFLFHQPNKFMLGKLADKIGVPREKMPSNIVENFGNASGVTVPTNISFNLGEMVVEGRKKVCLAGFGVGLTWSSVLMELGDLRFNQIIEY